MYTSGGYHFYVDLLKSFSDTLDKNATLMDQVCFPSQLQLQILFDEQGNELILTWKNFHQQHNLFPFFGFLHL